MGEASEESIFENTAAIIDEDTPGEWSISLMNGFYHVIVEFK